MNLILDVKGKFDFSIHVITTQAELVDLSGSRVTVAVPKAATLFADLKGMFPSFSEYSPDTDIITLQFNSAADAVCFWDELRKPENAVRAYADVNANVLTIETFDGQTEKLIAAKSGGRLYGANFFSFVGIYNFMQVFGEDKVYGERIALHDDMGGMVIDHKRRVLTVGAAYPIRKYDPVFDRRVAKVTVDLP